MKIWAADLRRPPPATAPAPRAVEFNEVGRATQGLLETAMGGEAELAGLRLQRGCRAFIGCVDGEVAAYGWLSAGPEWIGELGLEIRPPAGEAYIWNCVTAPRSRLHGHFRALLAHLGAVGRAEGLQRLWIGGVDGGAETAVVGAGFVPALHLQATTFAGLRHVSAWAPAGADPLITAAAMSVLGDGGWARRTLIGRRRTRRH